MKHFLQNSLRALFLSLAVLLSLPMLAEQVEIGGINYDLNAETKQATVKAKSSGEYSGSIVIPESVTNESTAYSVTSIGGFAFEYCSDLTSVTIPNSVTSIGYYAFRNCSGLTSVTIPNSVTSIGDYAFDGCSGLSSVTIGNSVTSIGSAAFSDCSDLTSVTIPNSVASIGVEAFSGCSGLTSIVVEEGNTVYDSRNNCNAIIETASNTLHFGCKTTIIPNSVTSIGDKAFIDCSGLTSVTIPNSVTSIRYCAFFGCSGLTSVTIPNSVTSIGRAAFSDCSGLTSVTIGNGVESIGAEAFCDCPELHDVYCYAENVPFTESNAFDGSYPENPTLHVPAASIDSYNETAPWSDFKNIVALPPFSGEVEIDGINYELNGETLQAAVIAKSSDKYSGSIVIPESVVYEGTAYSVTSIGDEAFLACSGLTSVTIPNSVTSIGYQAFACSGLTSVTIGNSVESIGGAAFYDCSGLTSVTIPNSVTSIEYQAFCFCSGLTSVTIPNSVTSIGINAFAYCSGLTSVTIGNGVESIGQLAFSNCSKLHDVYCYAKNVPFTESNAFGDSPIGTATLHVPAASVDSYNETVPWKDFGTIDAIPPFSGEVEIDGINYELVAKLKQATVIKKSSGYYSGEVVIPESVEHKGVAYSVARIGDSAFGGGLLAPSYLTSITIPNSVTSIGDNAFYNCSNLTSVHISDIAAWCNIDFADYDSNPLYDADLYLNLYLNGEEVKDLVIPDGVTSIKKYAFCRGDFFPSSFTSVTIPNSMTSIGEYAFKGCSRLTSVHISDIAVWCNIYFGGSNSNPLTYANHLYLNGEEVRDLVIPNSVTSIGSSAFEGCSGLTSVTIPNSVTSIGHGAFSGCSGLTSVTIPNSVTSIRYQAFEGCSGLTSVTIPNSVTSIGYQAFEGCSGLASVTIPNSVTSIDYYAFSGCSGLTSVTIGNSVTSIGSGAFRDCPELLDVYCYAEDVPSTESNAFNGSYIEYVNLHVPGASLQSYKSTSPWSGFGNIVALPNQYELTVSSAGYATLCLAFNAEIPQDVEVYVAEKVDADCLKMKKVEGVLPAMTGVIVKANEGTYAFIQSEDTPAEIGENLLVGYVANTMVTAKDNTSYYILAAPDDNVGMYPVELDENGAFVCKANKAYLPISSALARIYFDFGTETGIGEVKTENGEQKAEIYDLSGRKVQNAQKGIFIVNGKKVIK